MWFESLTGFSEESPAQVRDHLVVQGEAMVSRVNGRAMLCGELETPTLAELRRRVDAASAPAGSIDLTEVVGDVQRLHEDPENAGALFQVASQFNLLEMVSPRVTPESGVGIYEYDRTQGPACAIAAGAGTIYRNYFATVDGQPGQTADRQIDCSRDLRAALSRKINNAPDSLFEDEAAPLWEMLNGYLMPTEENLRQIDDCLAAATTDELDYFRSQLRIGLHWNTEVTLHNAGHVVTQAYCSALPVAYCGHGGVEEWSRFARLVLEAAYEATCLAALLENRIGPNRRLFLTLLGGGVFGNHRDWIRDAIARALCCVAGRGAALEVAVVSYGQSDPMMAELTASF